MAGGARIGVFGGTFDPIHNGHLAAAVNARHGADLDLVLLVVANQPWQKAGSRLISSAADRYAMAAAAVAEVDGLEASAVEMERGGVSYTADTLEELAARRPGARLSLVVGADVVPALSSWERLEEVQARADLIVVNRPGTVASLAPPGWAAVRSVEVPALDISSTDLRARTGDGRPLDFLVPPAVIRCIRQRNLYA